MQEAPVRFLGWEDPLEKGWTTQTPVFLGFPHGSADKDSSCDVGDLGLISGLGRCPGEGKGYPLQDSGLEKSVDCTVCGVAESQTQLSDAHLIPWPWMEPVPPAVEARSRNPGLSRKYPYLTFSVLLLSLVPGVGAGESERDGNPLISCLHASPQELWKRIYILLKSTKFEVKEEMRAPNNNSNKIENLLHIPRRQRASISFPCMRDSVQALAHLPHPWAFLGPCLLRGDST